MAKIKEPVKLRMREQKSGQTSLYLDIYINGRRKREYLKLSIVTKPRTPQERAHNAKTLQLAEAVRAKRLLEVQNGRFGFEVQSSSKGERLKLSDFVKAVQSTKSQSHQRAYRTLLLHIDRYRDGTRLSDVDEAWVRGFVRYLSNEAQGKGGENSPLSPNSQSLYFALLKVVIHEAIRKGYLNRGLLDGIKPPSKRETERTYLTLSELQAMASHPEGCPNPALMRAFLFSCLTGLRKSDVLSLVWDQVQEGEDGSARITFRQKKTGSLEYLDINDQARGYMGERSQGKEEIFEDFKYSEMTSKHLRAWAKSVGVDKPLSYHSSRHTFAVLMLDLGADIYTTSKLLGHRNLATTQVYAHILDKKKQEAVRLP